MVHAQVKEKKKKNTFAVGGADEVLTTGDLASYSDAARRNELF